MRALWYGKRRPELHWAVVSQVPVARAESSTWRSESISAEPVDTVNGRNCFWYLRIAFLVGQTCRAGKLDKRH